MKQLLPKLVRYGGVSAVSTSVSLTILAALVWTRTATPGWANAVATAAGTIPSFELNRRWVWGKSGPRSWAGEVVPFCVLSFTGLVLSTVVVSWASKWATGAGVDATAHTVVALGASVATFATLWLVQFAVLDRLLFRAPRRVAA